MTQPALSAEEILAWNEKIAQGWRQFLTEHPELLAQSCDIAGTKTVAELLQHIVAAQLRYASACQTFPSPTTPASPSTPSSPSTPPTIAPVILYRQLFVSDINWAETIRVYQHALMGQLAPIAKLSSSTDSSMASATTLS